MWKAVQRGMQPPTWERKTIFEEADNFKEYNMSNAMKIRLRYVSGTKKRGGWEELKREEGEAYVAEQTMSLQNKTNREHFGEN